MIARLLMLQDRLESGVRLDPQEIAAMNMASMLIDDAARWGQNDELHAMGAVASLPAIAAGRAG
jgi:hypothetical protein